MRLSSFRLPALTLLAATAVACQDINDPNEAVFDAALRQWTETEPAAYSFTLIRICVCTPDSTAVVLTVENRTVTSRTYQLTAEAVAPADVAKYPDIPGLFNLVREAIDGRVFQWQARFNQDYGYPEEAFFDYDAGRLDDNVAFAVVQFTPANPGPN